MALVAYDDSDSDNSEETQRPALVSKGTTTGKQTVKIGLPFNDVVSIVHLPSRHYYTVGFEAGLPDCIAFYLRAAPNVIVHSNLYNLSYSSVTVWCAICLLQSVDSDDSDDETAAPVIRRPKPVNYHV